MTPFRWALAALSFAAAILASLYIVQSSWPSERALVSLPWSVHLLLLGLALAELAARGGKVRLSAAALRIPMTYGTALRASAGGDFGAAITPARTGAEPARFLIMTEAGMKAAEIMLVIFGELFLEMISLAVVAAVMFTVFHGSGTMILGMVGLVAVYALFVLGSGAIGFALSKRHATGPAPVWAAWVGLTGGRWHAVQRALAQLSAGIDGMKEIRYGYAGGALLASVAHVALRLAVLPVIVYAFGRGVPLAPLILWPIALTYGGVLAPVPAGGGAIEFAFKATLGGAIPAPVFGAALVWWRFYTFYIFIILGALAAGGTVLRALRSDIVEDDGELLTSGASSSASSGSPAANRAGSGRGA